MRLQAAQDGAVGRQGQGRPGIPGVNRFVSRFVYTTCYTISYGVVFPSVLVARAIPKNNPIVHGLVDGAHAAVDMVDEMKKRKLEGAAGETAGSNRSLLRDHRFVRIWSGADWTAQNDLQLTPVLRLLARSGSTKGLDEPAGFRIL